MPRIPPDIARLARAHHRQLLELDKKARRAVEKQLSLALADVERELESMDPASFRAQQLRLVAFLADLTERLTTQRLEAVLDASVRTMYELAPRHTEAEVNEWLEYYGMEARPLNLKAIAAIADEAIIDRVPSSLGRWGPKIANRVKAEVAGMLTTRGNRAEATEAVKRAIEGERWRARRIVRTETMGAYNQAHHQSLTKARDEEGIDDLRKSAIATFDARTDEDSYPVHGQVRALEENFVDGDGRRYLHPPGRPNDREKEIPWLEPGIEEPRASNRSVASVEEMPDRAPDDPPPEFEEFADEWARMKTPVQWDVENPDATEEEIIDKLSEATPRLRAFAAAVRDGLVEFKLYDDDEFEEAYRDATKGMDPGGTEAFTQRLGCYVRKNLRSGSLTATAHEAAHVLDNILMEDGVQTKPQRVESEVRAFLLEDELREHLGEERVWKSQKRLVSFAKKMVGEDDEEDEDE